ncbi:hypothetical protein AZI86_11545 [Bdellovibrio bacteriovorus]|uniref:AraC effector-binding domain-containing protein n=1 Tax=Bdellovibrio bacteriovorus TaxID=959 RepID=A0A150WLE6_BDEBC|nr:GyrI-like domain-containing protein [Bdellovibrio bacteriovorus]KYG64829.1 hypothetical protein AZI86_11545 [Bdellovibrio bacteriovorus]
MNEKSFTVVGIKTRTSNVDEMNGVARIASLWNQFFANNIAEKIPNKLSGEILSVYHDYETDSSGPYSVMLGMKVSKATDVPGGLEVIQIPEQKYQVFPCAVGAMPEVVVQGWQQIWALEKSSEIQRKYSFDFELYPEQPGGAVNIFVAVK